MQGNVTDIKYYHVFKWATRTYKLGLQQYVKISPAGELSFILPMDELFWVMEQDHLSNKRNRF